MYVLEAGVLYGTKEEKSEKGDRRERPYSFLHREEETRAMWV